MTDRGGHEPQGIAGLASGLAGDIQDLIRGELRLARTEVDRSLRTLVLALVSILGGALVAFAGLVVLLEGVAAALALALPVWAAMLIVGGVIVIAGGLFAYAGIRKLSLETITPDQTIENVKQDLRVMKEHVR